MKQPDRLWQSRLAARKITYHERTQVINKLQRKHPGTTRQRNDHGAGRYSVDFFNKVGKLVATYDLPGET